MSFHSEADSAESQRTGVDEDVELDDGRVHSFGKGEASGNPDVDELEDGYRPLSEFFFNDQLEL